MKNGQWRNRSRQAVWLAAAGLLAAPMFAQAESEFTAGTTNLVSTAKLDFSIVVPRILFLQVGTGTARASNTAIDAIQFTVAAANVGTGSGVTVTGGDIGGGTVRASVISNSGTVSLTSRTNGPLKNAEGDTVSFSQISTAATTLTTDSVLPHPALADNAETTQTLSPVNRVVVRDAQWTFGFLNSVLVPPGTYGGSEANNGRVTYPATAP
jgi:hypothetical protein